MKEARRKIFLFFCALVLVAAVFIFDQPVLSYDTNAAHPFLTEKAVFLFNEQSQNKLTNEEINWLIEGARNEDTPFRWMNHFYNPNTGYGLPGYAPANVWADLSIVQMTYARGDQTWKTAIASYVGGDKKRAFMALGHVLHLIEDMAVPAHTRIDPHGLGDPYEDWVKLNTDGKYKIPGFTSIDNLNQVFNIIASYSNKYFLSQGTINTKLLKNKDIFYKQVSNQYLKCIQGNDGVNRFCLIILKKTKSGQQEEYNFDQAVHSDYYSLLAPKAIGYGAGVIDLFFRQAEAEKSKKLTAIEKIKQAMFKAGGILTGGLSNLADKYRAAMAGYSNSLVTADDLVPTAATAGQDLADNAGKVLNEQEAEPTASLEQKDVQVSEQSINPPNPPLLKGAESENPPSPPSITSGQALYQEGTTQAGENATSSNSLNPSNSLYQGSDGQAEENATSSNSILPEQETATSTPLLESSARVENTSTSTKVEDVYPKRKGFPDVLAPETTIISTPALISSSTAASFNFESSETGSTFDCQLNNLDWQACQPPKAYADLPDGQYIFKVRAIDASTNTDDSPAEYSWTIKTSTVAVAITSGPPSLASSTSAEFQLATDEPNPAYQYQLDAADWQTCLASTTLSSLTEGSHVFDARIIDQVGNISSSTEKTWLVDITAPASSVAALDASYATSSFTVSWSGTDADASGATSTASGIESFDVQYKIGAGEWLDWLSATASTSTLFNVAVDYGQTIYFRSRARDLAGNLEGWPVNADTQTTITQPLKNIVINQLQTGGASTEDEFIELYNPNDLEVDLSGYSIQYRGGGSQNFYTSNKKNFLADSVIKAKGYFLVAATSYAGQAAADLTYAGFVMASGGGTVFLVKSNDLLISSTATSSTVADRLAYGAGQYLFAETAAAAAPESGKSLVRQNGNDSDNNSADFTINNTPNPQGTLIYDIKRTDVTVPSNFGRDYMLTDFKPAASSLSGLAIKTTNSRAAGSFTATICQGSLATDTYQTKANCGTDVMVAQKTCDISNNWINNAWQYCNFDSALALVPNDNYYVIISGNTWVAASFSDTDYGVKVVCGFNSGGSSPYCFNSSNRPFLTLQTYGR